MRGLWARLGAVGLALFGALTIVTLSAATAQAGVRIDANRAEVGGLRVQIYSQMCDRGGPNLHTRLAVKNTSSTAKTILVHDTTARAVYDPPGPIPPGKGMLVHLTSSSRTPGHSLTLVAAGDTQTMTVPESPCTTSTSSSSTTSSTKPHGSSTTSTTKKPVTSSTINTVPPTVDPGGGPGGPPVVGPGVVAAGGSVASSGAVHAASTGTLPFTGSDLRAFALIGNFLVLIGFAMLFLSHRSPKAAAFFRRLRPGAAPTT